MIRFTNSNHKSDYRFGGYHIKVRDKFYEYSINTMNVAEDNDLCPFDLYKFSVKNYLKFSHRARTNTNYRDHTPVMSFDDTEHIKRYEVMILLRYVLDDFMMDELQKKRLRIYGNVMKKMLMLQFEVDSNREECEKRQRETLNNTLFGHLLTEPELTELKSTYRKAAFLCHPDVTGSDGSMFRAIKTAYDKKDLHKLRDLHTKLLTT